MSGKLGFLLGFLTVFVVSVGTANATAIIKSGDLYLGVNNAGHLNVRDTAANIAINSGSVGLTYGPLGDATSPGCLCEGWGVAGNGISGEASVHNGGIKNITVDSFTSTASTATSMTHLTSLPGLSITHYYKPSSDPTKLFEGKVTIKNTTGAKVTDVRYTRAMDWDIPPTEFREYVTIKGVGATNVLFTSDDGFASPDPFKTRKDLAGCGKTVDFDKCGPRDHGAIFDFGFGDLEDDESTEFSIFYGYANSEKEALDALGEVGAEVYSLGFARSGLSGSPSSHAYIFGFSGVGGTSLPDPTPDPKPNPNPNPNPGPNPVPEPASMILMGTGLVGLLRRKMKA